MLSNFFGGLFDSEGMSVISVSNFMICLLVALLLGFIIALGYMYKSNYTQSFVTTLAFLPAVVCVVIMMVNGNVGAGVAVAGAFSLVRFRSVPGSAREIGTLFMAMCTGLIAGMGYLGYSVLFTAFMVAVFIFYTSIQFGARKDRRACKVLRVVIPENLDYTNIFDDIFEEYLFKYEMISAKTTNMGSMFKLTYEIALKDCTKEKEMVDKLRCRNGNLEINISSITPSAEEL